MLKEKNTKPHPTMLEESASYYKRGKKKRMSSVPTMMKEEMGLAIKGEG